MKEYGNMRKRYDRQLDLTNEDLKSEELFNPIIKNIDNQVESFISEGDFYGNTEKILEKANKGYNKKIYIKIVLLIIVILFGAMINFLSLKDYREDIIEKCASNTKIMKMINDENFYDGIIVEGIQLAGKSKEEAKRLVKEIEPSLRDNINIDVLYQDRTIKLNSDDFIFDYNTDEVLEEAYMKARTGDINKRYNKILDMKKLPENFKISHKLNIDNLDLAVQKLQKEINIEAKDATVAKFDMESEPKFIYKEGNSGTELDVEDIKNKIKGLLNNKKSGRIEAIAKIIPYNVSANDLKNNIIKISSYSTVSTNTEDANENMRLAMQAINSTVLKPGEVLSFNQKTGDTTTGNNGYKLGGAISNNKLVQMYGGGICQASSTIYGAAIRANMTIVERSCHRWQSKYVPIGLDAAISYGSLDLKFRNDTENTVYIGSYMNQNTLICDFYGFKSNLYDNIEVESWITETIPEPQASYVVDETFSKGQQEVDVQARKGYKVAARKIFYKNGKQVKLEYLPSSYYKENAAVIKIGK